MKRNGNRGKKSGIVNRLLALCLTVIMMAGTLAGCGGSPAASTGEPGASAEDGTGTKDDGQKEETETGQEASDNEPTAMGRYVETAVDVSENTSRP